MTGEGGLGGASSGMPGSILGMRVTRIEDPDLITGRGCYVDDLQVDGLASLAFVRPPIAHGRVVRIDTAEARDHPGVIAALTAADLGAPTPPTSTSDPRPPPLRSPSPTTGEGPARLDPGMANVTYRC